MHENRINIFVDQILNAKEKAREAIFLTADYEETLELIVSLFGPIYPSILSVESLNYFFPNSTPVFQEFLRDIF